MKTISHPRDKLLNFEEKSHRYTREKEELTSVTKTISAYFEDFSPDEVILQMKKSKKWPNSPYFGMTDQAIKELWKRNGQEARELGTLMHAQIENYFLLAEQPSQPSVEFQQFLLFWQAFSALNPDFQPYRVEWRIHSKKVAGSIDFVLQGSQKQLVLVDWKRSKKIERRNFYSRGKGLLSHLEDCNFIHYSLQLNCYRAMLEKYYSKQVVAMYLVIFHPHQEGFQIIEVERMKEGELLIE